MRLALGYKTGLPRGKWREWEEDSRQLDKWAHRAFPKHRVLFISTEEQAPFQDDFWDSFLLAFVYGEPHEHDSHMVIGGPWAPKGSILLGVLAVSLEAKW